MRLQELTEGRRARDEPELSMLDYSYAPDDSRTATPSSNASLPAISSPPHQQQQIYTSLPGDTPSTLLSAPLPAPSIFPPPPTTQATLSPYTFDAYGNPSLDLGRGSPGPPPYSHGHQQANGPSSTSHGGGPSPSGVSQEAWLQGLDFDAMIGGAGVRQLPPMQHGGYSQQQQYQQQPRYGQQQPQWMGGTRAADLSEPFDEGGRWGVSMNQW